MMNTTPGNGPIKPAPQTPLVRQNATLDDVDFLDAAGKLDPFPLMNDGLEIRYGKPRPHSDPTASTKTYSSRSRFASEW